MRLAVIILAAGASVRMGRPKLLLPWSNTTVLDHLLQTWRSLGVRQLTVVCSPPPSAVEDELNRLNFPAAGRILNPQPTLGMFSSIQAAARWQGWERDLTHWAISLGDQPLVRPETLQQLINFAQGHPQSICQPAFEGRGRHPVVLPATPFRALADSPAAHLKQFLADYRSERCEIDDPGLDLDLDEPSDYAKALAHLEAARTP